MSDNQRRLVLATHNSGKRREFLALLPNLGAELVLPDDLGLHADVPETGDTYAANARLKAQALAEASGLVALGDDSGIEVECLGGAPGLYSARYAGHGASDADRRRKLLHEVRQFPRPWLARFVCVICVAVPQAGGGLSLTEFEGECRGEISPVARGSNGFGYDPIFWLPDRGATMAELPEDVKNTLSHRGRAVQAAESYLRALMAGK
ncbi:MAG: RdgB/HAM1 family non-canonical purine NTP pyrophosphatase [Anaerolineales bacterium]|nr:RdgB/HAM1 family non-canonical purine NTP pyrophosphatase [Anaerolineales bacterium]